MLQGVEEKQACKRAEQQEGRQSQEAGSLCSCYCTVEILLPLKLPLACWSFSWQPTTDPGVGERGGKRAQRIKAGKGRLLTAWT